MAIPKLLDLMRNSASKEYVDNNGGSFEAIYGETNYSEIVTAYNQGKTITCKVPTEAGNAGIPIYSTYALGVFPNEAEDNNLIFYNNQLAATNYNAANTTYAYIKIAPDSTWSYGIESFGRINTQLYNNTIVTPLTSETSYYRPILISTSEPTADDGKVGDIWIQYEE